ncbi:hypothetical protein QWY86_16100 [Pedobacter aquatilis]|uniref:hypothetical protein n=1 Tax=Pedobacter aquatilis TaxID=351343 RepID=UPI0025B328F1|nr:hypothetical protein [Pedobacter aquatilis]MDN3588207.1 hypothetical protein [Pedobacter aquatilis]
MQTTKIEKLSFKKYYLPLIYCTILCIYFLAAYNNYEYYHYDEHYQIIGFAQDRLGLTDDVSWEYSRAMRSTIQPTIFLQILKITNSLGFYETFAPAFISRLISGAFSFIAIYIFIQKKKDRIKPNLHMCYIILSFLVWYIPLISVRFSSETWSSGCILLAIAAVSNINSSTNKNLPVIGGLISFAGYTKPSLWAKNKVLGIHIMRRQIGTYMTTPEQVRPLLQSMH